MRNGEKFFARRKDNSSSKWRSWKFRGEAFRARGVCRVCQLNPNKTPPRWPYRRKIRIAGGEIFGSLIAERRRWSMGKYRRWMKPGKALSLTKESQEWVDRCHSICQLRQITRSQRKFAGSAGNVRRGKSIYFAWQKRKWWLSRTRNVFNALPTRWILHSSCRDANFYKNTIRRT